MSERSNAEQIAVVAKTYHTWITGLTLALISKKGSKIAEQFIFRLFRKQHHEKFLAGLEKLGLKNEPAAVACAKYHYFSNQLGGVSVEYLEETSKKAWIRYPPPRWIWFGSAICAVPENVNRAMLYGWHAQNGVTLGNPCLGFVCTGTTVEGAAGLEGFYIEFDSPIEPKDRLQFRFDLECPLIAKQELPKLDSQLWPMERKAKAYRNYAMEYIRTALPIVLNLLGEEEADRITILCSKQVGMQLYAELRKSFEIEDDSRESFIMFLSDFLTVSGDFVSNLSGNTLARDYWRLYPNKVFPFVERCETSLLSGMLAAHNRFLTLDRKANPEQTKFILT